MLSVVSDFGHVPRTTFAKVTTLPDLTYRQEPLDSILQNPVIETIGLDSVKKDVGLT